MSPEPEKVAVEVEGRNLVLTNLSKVLYPETGFTKGHVIDYYLRIAPALLPHIAGRPLTLRRYPDGVNGQHFYNKHAPDHRPSWVRTERIHSPGSTIRAGLGALRDRRRPAHPDLDSQPGRPGTAYPDVAPPAPGRARPPGLRPRPRVACHHRGVLRGRAAAPAAAGGPGTAAVREDLRRQRAAATGRAVRAQLRPGQHRGPVAGRATGTGAPRRDRVEHEKALRPGKVLIDWSQNNAVKTTVAPYSLRARSKPTVSTPVTWDEVAGCERPEDLVFTSEQALRRVAEHGDLLAPLIVAQPG